MGMMGMQPGMPMQQPTQGGMMSAPAGTDPNVQSYLRLADAIIQNPTPQTVMQVINALRGMSGQGTQETAQALGQIVNDPNALVQFAQQVKQYYGG